MTTEDYWVSLLTYVDSFISGAISFDRCLELMEDEAGPSPEIVDEVRHAIASWRLLEDTLPGFFTRDPKRGRIAIRMFIWGKTAEAAQEWQRLEQSLSGSADADTDSEPGTRAELVAELEGMGYFRQVSRERLDEVRAAAIAGEHTGEYDPLIGPETGRSVMIDAENIAEGYASDELGRLRPHLADMGVDLGDIGIADCDEGEQALLVGGGSYLLATANESDENDWYLPTRRALSVINALMQSRGTEERVYLLYMGELSLAVFMTPSMYSAIAESGVLTFPELESVEDTPERTDD